MRNKLPLLIVFLFINCILIFSQELEELNTRAEDDILIKTGLSIFYANNAIDNNKSYINTTEYIRSLYILARSYNRIEDYFNAEKYISLALKQLKLKGYNFVNSDFYIFTARFYYDNEKYELLKSFITNKSIISFLDNRGLIEFNIIKTYLNIKENVSFDIKIIEQSIALCSSNSFFDLEAELNILYGDYLANTDIIRARSYYKRAADISDSYFLAIANLRLGLLNNSIEYLEQAFLVSERLDDNKLIIMILNQLYDGYKNRSDFKNLALTSDRLRYFTDKNNKYILEQYKELYNFSYDKEKLIMELEESNSQISFLKLFIISLGAVIIILIIFLSIQSYRLRGINI